MGRHDRAYAYDAYGNVTGFEGLQADFDGNGEVGGPDYTILAFNFGTETGMVHSDGDATGDGGVLAADFTILSDTMGDVEAELAPINFSNSYTYTGRRFDTETELYYYRARYYDPKLGRFLSRDPIEYRGSPWNLYEYVSGSPLDRTDPKGLLDGNYSPSDPRLDQHFDGSGAEGKCSDPCKGKWTTIKVQTSRNPGGNSQERIDEAMEEANKIWSQCCIRFDSSPKSRPNTLDLYFTDRIGETRWWGWTDVDRDMFGHPIPGGGSSNIANHNIAFKLGQTVAHEIGHQLLGRGHTGGFTGLMKLENFTNGISKTQCKKARATASKMEADQAAGRPITPADGRAPK